MSHAEISHPVSSSTVPEPTVMIATDVVGGYRSVLGTYAECPLCGGELAPEHAHFKCAGCGWRDSCCD